MRKISLLSVLIFCCGLNALALGVADSNFGAAGTVSAGFGRGDDRIKMTGLCADGSMIGLGTAGAGQGRIYSLVKFTPQGTLDPTYGNDGVAVVYQPNLPYYLVNDPAALAVTPDCSAYIAGGFGRDMSVGKYDPSGRLVQTFDGGETGFLLNGVPLALAVQADGAVVVAGIQGSEYGKYTIYRYLPSGALDINFGDGGKSYVKMGWKGKPTSIRVENDGRYIVTGWMIPENVSTWDKTQSLIARYNFDGSLDSSFNNGGVYVNQVRTKGSEVYQTSFTLPDGRIMAAGAISDSALNCLFSRFTPNGLPDKFFGSRGHIIFTVPGGANLFAYRNDGGIFLANFSHVFKFDAEGNVDPSFGHERTPGMVTLSFYNPLYALTATADGKVVVSGAYFRGNPPGTGSSTYDYDFMAVRLNGNGSSDDSFGTDGTATRDAGDCSSYVSALALQPDGKIVIGGGVTGFSTGQLFGTGISRYNADGTVDPSFANHGKLYLNNQNTIDTMVSVKIQPDGKILAAGGVYGGLRVMRFDANGAVETEFGAGGAFTFFEPAVLLDDVALQPDGKILLAAHNINDFILIRLNADGTVDQTLGVVYTDVHNFDHAASMALQPDGRIIIAGDCGDAHNYDFCMVRYNPNGSLDQTFGRRGKVITDLGTNLDGLRSIALTSDGSIVGAGTRQGIPNVGLTVIKYTSSGMPDNTFGNNGVFNLPPGAGFYGWQASVQVLSDDSVVVANGLANNVSLLKLTAAGTPDTTWAPNGVLDTGIYNGGYHGPHTVLDANGRIVIAGTGNVLSGYIARFGSAN